MSTNGDVQTTIAALEKELYEKTQELRTLRGQLPAEPVGEYELLGPEGKSVALRDLFGDKRDLIVIHNMGTSCPYCTLWADGFNGVLAHLENRAALVLVSPDDPETQARFATSRGWGFRMLSNGDSGFTQAMGYSMERGGKTMMLPGCSTFRKVDDGSVTRVGHAPFGPGDSFCGVWHLFDLLEGGPGDWQPRFSY